MFFSVKNVLEDDRSSGGSDATTTLATTLHDNETSDYDDEYDFSSRTMKPPLRDPAVTTTRTTTFNGDYETVEKHKVN